MKPRQKKRLYLLLGVFVLAIIAVCLVLFAMRKDLNHYYSIEQIDAQQAPLHHEGIRVGGMVEVGSIKREGETLAIQFNLTDYKHPPITVKYTGILPDLFREGQGVMATGKLVNTHLFVASQILAKHDEKYMPPEVRDDLKKAGYYDMPSHQEQP